MSDGPLETIDSRPALRFAIDPAPGRRLFAAQRESGETNPVS